MRICKTEIERFIRAVLENKGVPPADARIVSDCLVMANLSGIDSHGVVRLAHYIRRLELGSIKSEPRVTVQHRAPSILYVDGDDGFGHVAGYRAVQASMEVCRAQGTVTVAVGGSSHFGPASFFLQEPVAAGLAGMVMTNTDAIVVPYGAACRFVGTNPIAFGFPAPGSPFMFDVSTSTISYGKIALARKEKRRIPKEWALDESGRPTADPRRVAGMHPMAGHKGSGLALTIDVLCALTTAMPFGPHINRMYFELDEPRRLGHFMTFWDIARFVPLEEFKRRMGQMIDELHQLPRYRGFEEIYYPGELEARYRSERLENGIPVEEGLYRELIGIAHRHGIEAPLPIEEGR